MVFFYNNNTGHLLVPYPPLGVSSIGVSHPRGLWWKGSGELSRPSLTRESEDIGRVYISFRLHGSITVLSPSRAGGSGCPDFALALAAHELLLLLWTLIYVWKEFYYCGH